MNPKQKATIYLAASALLALLLFIVFSDHGFIDLQRLRKHKKTLIQTNSGITRENLSLYREIERLKNDPKYIEHVARQELGVIGKDEVILKFKQTGGTKAEK